MGRHLGAGDKAHAEKAMASLEKTLIRKDDKLALLFAPPFDHTKLEPGYIKGYPAGVRENGGQYTHGAVWSIIAFAMMGEGNKAAELFEMINPIQHTKTKDEAHRFKVEPYVICADLYSMPPNTGRGGWTWYTGSAGWMYRAGLEWILGFRLQGSSLSIDPSIPKDWPGFEIAFRFRSARYTLVVENPYGVCRGIKSVELDGKPIVHGEHRIPLIDDGKMHKVKVALG